MHRQEQRWSITSTFGRKPRIWYRPTTLSHLQHKYSECNRGELSCSESRRRIATPTGFISMIYKSLKCPPPSPHHLRPTLHPQTRTLPAALRGTSILGRKRVDAEE